MRKTTSSFPSRRTGTRNLWRSQRRSTTRSATKSGQLDFPYRFLTQKEFDPDFIAFNSENRRYHFIMRVYQPNRSQFLQIDPFYFLRTRSTFRRFEHPYQYVSGRPTVAVDPWGLSILMGGAYFVPSPLPRATDDSDQCECGKATVHLQPDTTFAHEVFDQRLKGFSRGTVGLEAWFNWDPRETMNHCYECCNHVTWDQAKSLDRGGSWLPDNPDPDGLGHVFGHDPGGDWMQDHPGPDLRFSPAPVEVERIFVSRATCDSGEKAGQVMYTITWGYKLWRPSWFHNWRLFYQLWGECGGSATTPPKEVGQLVSFFKNPPDPSSSSGGYIPMPAPFGAKRFP